MLDNYNVIDAKDCKSGSPAAPIRQLGSYNPPCIYYLHKKYNKLLQHRESVLAELRISYSNYNIRQNLSIF